MDIGNHMFSFNIITFDFVISENNYIIYYIIYYIKLKTKSLTVLNIFYINEKFILFISLINQTFTVTTIIKIDVKMRIDNE